MPKHVVIVGGGAAGFFAAIHIKQRDPGIQVTLFEKSKQCLAKVKVSGGGRCNVTHACFDPALLCTHYPRGEKALRGGFHVFSPRHTIDWFEAHGVALKTEADGRMFPVTDSSQTVVDCLLGVARDTGVRVRVQAAVVSACRLDHGFMLGLVCGEQVACDALVLATGSARGGYGLASSLGHTVVDLMPSLFSMKVRDPALHALRGVSVQDAMVWVQGRKKQAQRGGMLATHWGLSGPAVIKLSAWQAKLFYGAGYNVTVGINVLPDMGAQVVLDALQVYALEHAKRVVCGYSPFAVLPQRLWAYWLQRIGIVDHQVWGGLSQKAFARIQNALQCSEFEVTGKGPFKEEFVTCGGVSLKEMDMKTMQSKCCDGLYVVGECLDVDGVTGGFNFQHAWTSGYLAASAIASS